MALDYSITLRNNRLQQIQTTIGGAGVLKIFSGAEPPNCTAPDPTGLLVTIGLPSVFIAVSGGVTSLVGSWVGTASSGGTPACFRMYDGSLVCHVQGGIPAEMTVTPSTITLSQTVTVNTFGVTAGNP
jgi:hypothetical protein